MEDPKQRIFKMFDTIALEHSDDYLEILKAREITVNGQKIKFDFEQFGTRPPTGFSLFIGLPPKGDSISNNIVVWDIYKKQYKMPEGSIWIVPLAPNTNLNVWTESYIDNVLTELIACFNSNKIINANKVYIAGFSSGGDGVYKLGPRLASWFAAASTMGGHPNGASLVSLRNLPFSIQVGTQDTAFYRNKVNQQYADMLKNLNQNDPKGYTHMFKTHNCGHMLNLKDAHAFKWMHQYERNPYPEYVVWRQCGEVPKANFYYLKVVHPMPSAVLTCRRKGNTFTIESKDVTTVSIQLNDLFVDLDEPIIVKYNGAIVFEDLVGRDWNLVRKTLTERLDPYFAFCAIVTVAISK